MHYLITFTLIVLAPHIIAVDSGSHIQHELQKTIESLNKKRNKKSRS